MQKHHKNRKQVLPKIHSIKFRQITKLYIRRADLEFKRTKTIQLNPVDFLEIN